MKPLNVAELYRHLSDGANNKAVATGLEETLSEATYIHAGFARPDRPDEQARQGWKSIWNKQLQENLQMDLQAAKRQCAENASEENLTRVMSLRAQIEAINRESAGDDDME